MILLDYKTKLTVPFGNGEHKTIYELTILKTRFFGLIKREFKHRYELSMFANRKDYEAHWDYMIQTKEKFHSLD